MKIQFFIAAILIIACFGGCNSGTDSNKLSDGPTEKDPSLEQARRAIYGDKKDSSAYLVRLHTDVHVKSSNEANADLIETLLHRICSSSSFDIGQQTDLIYEGNDSITMVRRRIYNAFADSIQDRCSMNYVLISNVGAIRKMLNARFVSSTDSVYLLVYEDGFHTAVKLMNKRIYSVFHGYKGDRLFWF